MQQGEKIAHSEILSVWKTAIETQKHFAELSIKMRQLGLTLTGAVLAVAIVLLKDEAQTVVTLFGLKLPLVSLVFFTAAGVLYAASVLDVKVYHKMLRGAVRFNELFEDKHAEEMFGTVGMTQTISAYSRNKETPELLPQTKRWLPPKKSYNAGRKITLFYWVPMMALISIGIAAIFSANVSDIDIPSSAGQIASVEVEDSFVSGK